MAERGEIKNTMESLLSGLETFLTTKSVVGEPIKVDDTVLIPLMDVSFGVGAGAFGEEKNNNGAGGIGGKMTPNAMIVIQNGDTHMIRINDKDQLNKLLDMVPGIINRFAPNSSTGAEEEVE